MREFVYSRTASAQHVVCEMAPGVMLPGATQALLGNRLEQLLPPAAHSEAGASVQFAHPGVEFQHLAHTLW